MCYFCENLGLQPAPSGDFVAEAVASDDGLSKAPLAGIAELPAIAPPQTAQLEDGIDTAIAYSEGSDAAASTATAYSAEAGDTFSGSIGSTGDKDWVRITIPAGETFTFQTVSSGAGALPNYNITSNLYNSSGGLIKGEDSYTSTTSTITYENTSASPVTVYLEVFDFGNNNTGNYTLNISKPSPLDAIDWGGSAVASTNVTVYFAGAGEVFDGRTSDGWTQAQINGAMAALSDLTQGTNLTFTVTNNPNTATFKFVTDSWVSSTYAYMNPPVVANPGVAVFNTYNMDMANLAKGSLEYFVFQHEVGHGLGMSHPHDTGGGSPVMNGVSSSSDMGDMNLNQGIHTMMSYNVGHWELYSAWPSAYGATAGPMAFDIALLQQKYGAQAANTGNNIYYLPDANATGTFYSCIWDTGGTDTIAYLGSRNVIISLVAATLDYSATGGGPVSYANGIRGGFTIANGVIIENATGGSGNDTIVGNSANNTLKGGAGNDTINGSDGNDVLQGDAGADNLNGGSGSDWAFYDMSAAGVTVNLTDVLAESGGDAQGDVLSNIENIYGSTSNDTLIGNYLNNYLRGNGGNDMLSGSGGNDTLRGDAGNDLLTGGLGADIINGGTGIDWARYHSSTAGVNVNLNGGVQSGGDAQGDTLFWIENVFGSNFNDTLTGDGANNFLRGYGGNDILNGSGGNDTLFGEEGNDLLTGGTGIDVLNGGNGIDWARYHTSSAGVNVNLNVGTQSGGDAQGDMLANIENLFGSSFNDTLTGNASANFLRGHGGNDILIGAGGNDTLFGEAGNDLLIGGAGADILNGGSGNDWARYHSSSAAVNINLTVGTQSGGDAQGDMLANIENIFGSSFNDTISGNSSNNYLRGHLGNDTLSGGNGNDILKGGIGSDILIGGSGFDWAFYDNSNAAVNVNLNDGLAETGGHAQGDTLSGVENIFGSSFNDTITGDSGNNAIRGFAGNDTLAGNAGSDTFYFMSAGDSDVIMDFQDGIDMISIGLGLTSFSQLTITDSGANALVSYASSSLWLLNFDHNLLGADDFQFV
jgi:Ca2+-binding RTX toxin-like protein